MPKTIQIAAKSTNLKEQVADLQKALAVTIDAQVAIDKLPQKVHEALVSNIKDREQGLDDMKLALKVHQDRDTSPRPCMDAPWRAIVRPAPLRTMDRLPV